MPESGANQNVVIHYTTFEHLTMISRNRRTNYDPVWQQLKVWRTLSNNRQWNSLI